MIYPTNMANAIIKEVIGASYKVELNDDGSVNFDTLEPLENPIDPTPKNLQKKIGDAFKNYLEENMTFVIQVISPPVMSNGGYPSPDPILSLITAGCPLTGVLKCGGEFSCESLLPADIAIGLANLLQGSYLSVSSPLDLIPGELPQPPVISLPDLTPEIILPSIELEIPTPTIDFNFPSIKIDPSKININPIINFDAFLNNANIPIKVTPKITMPISISLTVPELEIEMGEISITPSAPQVELEMPTPSLPTPEISIDGLNIIFEIPDIDMGKGIVKLTFPEMSLKVADLSIKAKDLALPNINLSGAYQIELEFKILTDGNANSALLELVLSPLILEVNIPKIGPITIEAGDIGPAEVKIGKFSFNLNPCMVSIPFLKPIIIPETGIAVSKDFGTISIMDTISIDPIEIPKILDPVTKTIGPINLPKIDLSKYNIDWSRKGTYTFSVKYTLDIQVDPIKLEKIPLSEYIDIKISGIEENLAVLEEPLEVEFEMPKLKGLKMKFGIDLLSVFPLKIPIPSGVCNAGLNLKNYCQNLVVKGDYSVFAGPVVASIYWQKICAVIWMCLVGISPTAGDPMSGLCGDQYILSAVPSPAPSLPPAPTTLIWINPIAPLNPVITPGSAQILMAL